MRLFLAIRVFFAILFRAEVAQQAEQWLAVGDQPPQEVEHSKPPPLSKPAAAAGADRSEALTLLATLQREARFVDLVLEPLDGYGDAQIGAAARDVLRDCSSVLERLFALRSVVSEPEGSEVEVPQGAAGRFHLIGNVAGEPPWRGRLVHHGWEATRCELPVWSGSSEATRVIAAAEVELPAGKES